MTTEQSNKLQDLANRTNNVGNLAHNVFVIDGAPVPFVLMVFEVGGIHFASNLAETAAVLQSLKNAIAVLEKDVATPTGAKYDD